MRYTKQAQSQEVRYEKDVDFTNSTFPEIVKHQRAKYGIKASDLSALLGIGKDVFRGKCNGQRPATRDFVIGVCAVLRMCSYDVSEALRNHKVKFPGLDESNDRDDCISKLLNEELPQKYSRPTNEIIQEINNTLRQRGYRELDIIDHRNNPQPAQKKEAPQLHFKITGQKVQMLTADTALYGDQYDSLETEYSICRCRCLGKMWIEDPKTHKVFLFQCTDDGDLFSYEDASILKVKRFSSIAETGSFIVFFSKLKAITDDYHNALLKRLDDTRNFGERVSANLRAGNIHIYAEKYNYDYPEANEYYVMEYENGRYTLSVYHQSAFMSLHLGEIDYREQFHSKPAIPMYQFRSLEEMDAFAKDESKPYWQRQLIPLRKKAFRSLLPIVNDLLSKLKDRKVYIRNPEIIRDNVGEPAWICRFFGVEKEYECHTGIDDIAGDLLFYGKEEAYFPQQDGSVLTVSIDELKKAFELGFHNIDEICQVKHERGAVIANF